MKKRVMFLLLVIFCLFALASCGPSAPRISFSSVINIARIETTVNEDGSGHNNFWLVVPANKNCPLLDLKPALESITKPTSPLVAFVRNEDFMGYMVTYSFDYTDQIPAEIGNIKSVVIDAAIAAIPTSTPAISQNTETPMPTALPPIRVGDYIDDNQLSIKFSARTKELTGQKWTLRVIVNPFLMTGLITEESSTSGLAEGCSIPTFTYQLNVSNNMKINDFPVDTQSNLTSFSKVRRISDNSIEWTIESRQAFQVRKSELQALFNATPAANATDIANYFENLYRGKIYTLTVNATNPSPWFTFLTGVLAPLLGLLAVSLGLLVGFRNLWRKEKS